jgi:tRNA A-37 threonylcarbamoyl transferase component Bud32/tetratricopeptide (TPR) repeat protein
MISQAPTAKDTRPAAGPPVAPMRVPGYEILQELGRGGMGVVYKARQVKLDRVVALKMILAGNCAGPGERGRFLNEAHAAAQLPHPNIVGVYEVGEYDGGLFVALEYCPGDNLGKRLDGTPLPPPAAARLIETIARGVAAAHAAGIVHRDLKPANILLSAEGTPKVSDFGLARSLDDDPAPGSENRPGRTTTGAILGTPSYMAPEQAAGAAKHAGRAADVYSLGAILYELLTGRPPFKGASMLETLEQVRSWEPVSPRQLNPQAPRDLETICLKCLEKAPARRYADAGELADELLRFLNGESIVARPVTAPERAWRWCRRNPAWAALGGAVAVLLAATSAVSATAYLMVREKNLAIQEEVRQKEEQRLAAEQARDLAERRRKHAASALDFFVNRVQSELTDALFAGGARQRILELALERLRQDVEAGQGADGLADRALMGACLKAGDLSWDQGQHEKAAGFYQRAYAAAERLHRADPASDKAKGNFALMVARMARVAAWRKNPEEARRCQQRALALQKAIVEEPKSGEIPPHEAMLSLAGSYAALGEWPKAVRLQRRVLRDRPSATARESLAGSLEQMAKQTAGPGRKREYLRECVGLRSELAAGDPTRQRFQYLLALGLGELADEELFAGAQDEAQKHYDRCVKVYRELLGGAEMFVLRRKLGQAYYGAATAALRRGDRAASLRTFHECLRLREGLVRERPRDLHLQLDLMVTRARCGQHAAAAGMAGNLHRQAGKNVRLLFQALCAFALCSDAVAPGKSPGEISDADRKLRAEYRARALGVLRDMVAAGYRDRRELEIDPDLDPIRDEPGFQSVLEELRKKKT